MSCAIFAYAVSSEYPIAASLFSAPENPLKHLVFYSLKNNILLGKHLYVILHLCGIKDVNYLTEATDHFSIKIKWHFSFMTHRLNKKPLLVKDTQIHPVKFLIDNAEHTRRFRHEILHNV